MVVIVVIPITIGMPATAVLVPPAMSLPPAAFPRLVQIVARAVRLPAVPAVMLHGFVESVVGFGDAALALIVTLGGCPGCTRECQHRKQCSRGQHYSGEKPLPSRLYGHGFSILHVSPLLDWGIWPHAMKHRTGKRVAIIGPHHKIMRIKVLLSDERQYACKK